MAALFVFLDEQCHRDGVGGGIALAVDAAAAFDLPHAAAQLCNDVETIPFTDSPAPGAQQAGHPPGGSGLVPGVGTAVGGHGIGNVADVANGLCHGPDGSGGHIALATLITLVFHPHGGRPFGRGIDREGVPVEKHRTERGIQLIEAPPLGGGGPALPQHPVVAAGMVGAGFIHIDTGAQDMTFSQFEPHRRPGIIHIEFLGTGAAVFHPCHIQGDTMHHRQTGPFAQFPAYQPKPVAVLAVQDLACGIAGNQSHQRTGIQKTAGTVLGLHRNKTAGAQVFHPIVQGLVFVVFHLKIQAQRAALGTGVKSQIQACTPPFGTGKKRGAPPVPPQVQQVLPHKNC